MRPVIITYWHVPTLVALCGYDTFELLCDDNVLEINETNSLQDSYDPSGQPHISSQM